MVLETLNGYEIRQNVIHMGGSPERGQLVCREKTKKFPFKNILFVKLIYATFKCDKVSGAKLFYKNIYLKTLLLVAVHPKK